MNENTHEYINRSDLERIERKLDTLSEAISKLMIFEERLTILTTRIDKSDTRISALETELLVTARRIDKWLYLGTGAWVVMVVAFEIARVFIRV